MKVRSGQNMMEMLIAIAVIMISTFATIGLIITTITAGRMSQNRIEAANFAREGIEVVRSIRDGNWLRRDQNIYHGAELFKWDDDCTNVASYRSFQTDPAQSNYVLLFRPAGLPPCFSSFRAGLIILPANTNLYQCDSNTPTNRCRIARCLDDPSEPAEPITPFYQQNLVFESSICKFTKYYRYLTVIEKKKSVNIGGTSKDLDYLDITAVVTWTERGGQRKVVAREQLYNWR